MEWLLKILPVPSSERLAARIVKALIRAGATEVRREPGSLDIEFQSASGSKVMMNLENLHRACRFSWPWRRRALRERFLRPFFEDIDVPDSWAEAAPDVFPALRDSYFFEAVRVQRCIDGKDLNDMPAGRPLTDRLLIHLVYDTYEHMVPVSDAALAKWGVTFDQALQRALANFEEANEPKWNRPYPGVFVSAWKDDYDATRLLLGSTLRGIEVDGMPVAFVPSRDTLILTGSNDLAGLIHGFNLAMTSVARANAMSLLPLRRTAMGWEPFVLTPDHLGYEIYQRLRVTEYGELYTAQRQLLMELAEKTGDETYIAAYTERQERLEDGNECPRGTCVWARGCRALLPEVDDVAFVDPERPEGEQLLAVVPWKLVVEACGAKMRRSEHVPPRFLVEDFPSEEELRSMGVVAPALRSQ